MKNLCGVGRFLYRDYKLFDRRTRENIELVGINGLDVGKDFVVSSGTDHGGIITGEFWCREEDFEIRVAERSLSFGAKGLIGADATSKDNRFDIRMALEGGVKFF